MPETMTGGCQCGHVRYEVAVDPAYKLHVCHCTDCQKQSGSAFSITWIVPEDAFRLTRGELETFTHAAESGRSKSGAFCPQCGNRIYNMVEWRPGTISVKPGTLDETDFLQPTRHVWTRSKQAWVEIPADAEVYEKGPPGS